MAAMMTLRQRVGKASDSNAIRESRDSIRVERRRRLNSLRRDVSILTFALKNFSTRKRRHHLCSSTPTLLIRRVFLRFRKTNHCFCVAASKFSATPTANGPLIRYRERIGQ
jgi:hypothetical protein